MIIGVPREVKDHESRVGLVPHGVAALVSAGHKVLVQSRAGSLSSIPDQEYVEAGARVLPVAADVWGQADIVVKVKEPQSSEYGYLRDGLTLFTYLHLAPLPDLTQVLMNTGVTAIAYETIQEPDGSLPLLTPMSEVAGKMSVQIGAQYLEAPSGGRGVLLGGVAGVAPGNVTVLGAGVVGHAACKVAVGMGANVTMIDKSLPRLREVEDIYNGVVTTLASNPWTVSESVRQADLVIGAILIPGASAPKVVTREMISKMKRGSVVVDVAIDQGGCFETSKPTTHTAPTYYVDNVLHYCVSNMPAAVPNTSTYALNNSTFPYLTELASKGVHDAIASNPSLASGVNTFRGKCTYPAVAESQGIAYTEISTLL